MRARNCTLPRSLAALVLALSLSLPRLAAASTVLVVGDSLSAARGIDVARGWVHLLAERLAPAHQVVNASISGDTTLGGLTRLPAALAAHRPDVVVVELGGNDGLRGLPLEEMRRNLEAIVERCRDAGARVLLLGVRMPPNLGPVYTKRFQQVYRDVARRYRVPLVPFLLEGVAARPGMMQEDGLHPTAAGEPRILANVWPALAPLLGLR